MTLLFMFSNVSSRKSVKVDVFVGRVRYQYLSEEFNFHRFYSKIIAGGVNDGGA